MHLLRIFEIIDAEEDDRQTVKQLQTMMLGKMQCSVVTHDQRVIGRMRQLARQHVPEALNACRIRMVLHVHILGIEADARPL